MLEMQFLFRFSGYWRFFSACAAVLTLSVFAPTTNAMIINEGESLDAPFDFTSVPGFTLPATDYTINVLFKDLDLIDPEEMQVDLYGDAGSLEKSQTFSGFSDPGIPGFLAGFFYFNEVIPTSLIDGVGFWKLTMIKGSVNISSVTTRARDADKEELFEVVSVAPVPEPSILGLFGIGLAGLGWSRRKKV